MMRVFSVSRSCRRRIGGGAHKYKPDICRSCAGATGPGGRPVKQGYDFTFDYK